MSPFRLVSENLRQGHLSPESERGVVQSSDISFNEESVKGMRAPAPITPALGKLRQADLSDSWPAWSTIVTSRPSKAT